MLCSSCARMPDDSGPVGRKIPPCSEIIVPAGVSWNIPVLLAEKDVPPLTKEEWYWHFPNPKAAQSNSWFIFVGDYPQGEDPYPRDIRRYGYPDTTSSRIRRGYGSVHSCCVNFRPPRYIQVSVPDKPFGKDLKTPTLATLPFWASPEIPEPELISAIDFAREQFDADTGPIMAAYKTKDGMEIHASVHKSPSAECSVLEIQNTSNKWTVIRAGGIATH